jgi:hypothetical protein
MIGSTEYLLQQTNNIAHDFSGYDEVDDKYKPFIAKKTKSTDEYYRSLQQKMMDFGWRLNENDDGNVYFTHPTYDNTNNKYGYTAHCYTLTNCKEIMIPLVDREKDPKGLGCTMVQTSVTGHFKVETNEWKSYWDNRSGRRRAAYLNYLDKRQKKREEFIEMSKTDSSIKVWTKDTPRCDPLTWKYNNPSPSVGFEFEA